MGGGGGKVVVLLDGYFIVSCTIMYLEVIRGKGAALYPFLTFVFRLMARFSISFRSPSRPRTLFYPLDTVFYSRTCGLYLRSKYLVFFVLSKTDF